MRTRDGFLCIDLSAMKLPERHPRIIVNKIAIDGGEFDPGPVLSRWWFSEALGTDIRHGVYRWVRGAWR